MTMEDRTQRPYRYGMILLCLGALINWLGFSEGPTPNSEPIRYLGVACILGGALLILSAMCCWLKAPNRTGDSNEESVDPIHVITIADERRREKPPDYDQVTSSPPSYDDAIKLDPSALLKASQPNNSIFLPNQIGATNNAFSLSSESTAAATVPVTTVAATATATRPVSSPSSSTSFPASIISKLKASGSSATVSVENEKPPAYSITSS